MPDPPLPPVLVGTEWTTRAPEKLVLGVVHNTTSATRLFDVIPWLAQDPRIQVVFTCTGSSPFTAGAHEYLVRRGVKVITWAEALRLPADLAVATSHGELHELTCPLIILPHGMGYNKYLENRKPKTENRRRFSVCLPSGCCTRAGSSRRPWFSRTKNRWTGCGRCAPRPSRPLS